jgi:hypothetical protein
MRARIRTAHWILKAGDVASIVEGIGGDARPEGGFGEPSTPAELAILRRSSVSFVDSTHRFLAILQVAR